MNLSCTLALCVYKYLAITCKDRQELLYMIIYLYLPHVCKVEYSRSKILYYSKSYIQMFALGLELLIYIKKNRCKIGK